MAVEKLSATLVDKLLDKLSSDDDFRSLFEKSPAAALAELGYQPADEAQSAALCLAVTSLASKEQIRASRAELHTALSARLPKGGFGLQAS